MFSLLTTTVLKGFNNGALFPTNSEQRKEGHHVKVRSTEGRADGAKGLSVDASLILIDVHTPQQMRCVSNSASSVALEFTFVTHRVLHASDRPQLQIGAMTTTSSPPTSVRRSLPLAYGAVRRTKTSPYRSSRVSRASWCSNPWQRASSNTIYMLCLQGIAMR